MSADNMIMFIDSYALQYGKTYELLVEIKNDQPSGQTRTQTLAFTTQEEPTAGLLSVSP